MGCKEIEKLGYIQLKDLEIELVDDTQSDCFVVCFWIYLPKSTPFPCTILLQTHCLSPFLGLNKDRKLVFSPSILDDDHEFPENVPSLTSETEFPLEQWVHLGCEVSLDVIRIYLDGKPVGEKILNFPPDELSIFDSMYSKDTVILYGVRDHIGYPKEEEVIDGYVYKAELFFSVSSSNIHHVKDPPLQLCIDSASASDVEIESDGIWNIVGGKVSCRQSFSLDIVLLDAFGRPVHKELKVVASLVYADDWSLVEKSEDNEDPLLAISDGLEFPSDDLPSKMVNGRASFKLKISQLSSKCNDKLFRIMFYIPELGNHPFLEAFTPMIRCISRTSNTTMSTITWKKLPSGVHLFNGSTSPQHAVELQQKSSYETRSNPPSKKVKLGEDTPMEDTEADTSMQQTEEECNSCKVPENMAIGNSLGCIQENYGGIDNSASDTESDGDARSSEMKSMPCIEELLSDSSIFRYCLGSLSERLAILKEISLYASDSDIADMADKVAFFSGCAHHRHQILIAKGLLEEGEKAWNIISRKTQKVNWDDVVFEIEEQFMRVACCSTRSLTQEDLNFLRRSFGGQEYMSRDDFDRMWQFLYPIAFSISREGINSLWGSSTSSSPKWIEGFVTKEEVDYALRSRLCGISEPGTFILRFPTTRSWPHPDAGSLVASYVAKDFSLHHRLLALDYSCGMPNSNPLQELLLSEPELSRVGRITRSNLTV